MAAYTRQQWATDFLHAIGNANPAPATIAWVVGWTKAETGNLATGAQYNPLNTTQPAPGSWLFNTLGSSTFGVRNYTSYAQGLQANAQVLQNGLYSGLLGALRNNDTQSLGVSNGQPSSGVLAGLRTWSGGAGASYVANILGSMGVGYEGVNVGGSSAPAAAPKGVTVASSPTAAPATSNAGSGGGGGGSGGSGIPTICTIPGAVLLIPGCQGQITQGVGQTNTQTVNSVLNGQALQDAITGAAQSLGNGLLNAIGVKSTTDLEQRAGLIGVALVLFFVGVAVLFFSHKDQVIGAATEAAAPEAAPEVEEAEAAKEAKPKQGFKRGKEEDSSESGT